MRLYYVHYAIVHIIFILHTFILLLYTIYFHKNYIYMAVVFCFLENKYTLKCIELFGKPCKQLITK